MKKLILAMLVIGTAVVPCMAQRHPNNSRPYHPPAPVPREIRRVVAPSAKPQPGTQQQPVQGQATPVSQPATAKRSAK